MYSILCCIRSLTHIHMFHIFNNSSGGRARRDFECVQGGSGSLLVQRQSQHQGWGAGLWDGHQMDKTRLQLQSSGNKKKKEIWWVCLWNMSALLCSDAAVYFTKMSTHVCVSWDKESEVKRLLPLTVRILYVCS